MEKLYLCLPSFLEDWQNKRLNISQSDFNVASELYNKLKKERGDIYDIDGDTMIINICGPLSNSGPDLFDLFFGISGTGYNEISEALELAEDNQIKNIIVNYNTPGGEVGSIDNIWKKFYDLRNSGKNITAINRGMIASGGYYLASAANRILSDGAANITGSIGVVTTAIDTTGMYKNNGIIVKQITSSNAKNKRPDIKTKEGEAVIQEHVDALENIFHDRIARGRGITREKIINDFGQGKVFITENPDINGVDAIRIGMIDGLVTKSSKLDDKNITNPAVKAGTEEKAMTFLEMLASNPAYQAEYEKLCRDQYNAGLAEGKNQVKCVIEKVVPFLNSANYPDSIKTLAIDVLSGKEEHAVLRGSVIAYDALTEKSKSDAAKNEQKQDVPASDMTLSTDGEIRSEADFQAMVAQMKKSQGRA